MKRNPALDLDAATIQCGYKRGIGVDVLRLVSYLNKNVRQEVQIYGDCSDLFRHFFDGLPEITERFEAFGQLNGG